MKIGIIGYGVRMDMLMDSFYKFEKDFKIAAITDNNIEKVKALLNHNSVDKKTFYELDLEKVDSYLRNTRIDSEDINFYTDADEMLNSEDLDGVMIGTSCDSHAYFAEKVMKRNLPLFLEKPVGISYEDLRVLENARKESKSEVVVSFSLRATRLIRELKKIVDSGRIGKIENVQAYNDVPYGFVYFHDWYRDVAKSNGLFLQKATHDLDIINYLVGEKPIKVCAMKSKQIFKGEMPAGLRCSQCEKENTCEESSYYIKNFRFDEPRNDYCCFAVDTGNEDSGSVIIRYESGMHVAYTQNFFARKSAGRRGARLYGYRGTIDYSFTNDEIKIIDHMSNKVETIQMNTPPGGHGGGDEQLVLNFINVMKGTEKSFTPLSEGIISAAICLAAKKSSETDNFCNVVW